MFEFQTWNFVLRVRNYFSTTIIIVTNIYINSVCKMDLKCVTYAELLWLLFCRNFWNRGWRRVWKRSVWKRRVWKIHKLIHARFVFRFFKDLLWLLIKLCHHIPQLPVKYWQCPWHFFIIFEVCSPDTLHSSPVLIISFFFLKKYFICLN